MNIDARVLQSRYWPIAAFLVFSVLLISVGFALKHQLFKINKAEVSRNLASIGHLKVNQIRSYLDERRGDAIALTNFLNVHEAHQWLVRKSEAKLPASLLSPLNKVITANQYGGMLLLDDKADIRLNLGQYPQLSDAGKTMALGVLHGKIPMAFQIYFGDPSHPQKPLLDIFVPVVNPDNSQPIGVLVIRDDLHFLYQLINTWPGDSRTAESLLVTREGDNVLFLNELRHKKNTALRLRIALSGDTHTPGWPAILAAQGYTELLEVNDYWGKPVLAYTLPVPDSPWGMVVKVEMSEAMKPITRLQSIAWVIAGLLITLSACVASLWWYKQESERASRERLNGALDKLHQREIVLAEFKHTLDQVHDCIFMFSPDTLRFSYVNQGATSQLGYSESELLTMGTLDIKTDYSEEQFRTLLRPLLNAEVSSVTFETVHRHQDGHTIPVEVYIQAVRQEDQKLICVDLVRDISERKQAEEEIYQLAYYDPLTRLPNRRMVYERLRQAMARSKRDGEYGAVMFLDLDHFKSINDLQGHEVGDLLLIEIANRLQRCMRDGDTVARLGGDEFVVLVESLGHEQDVAVNLAKLIAEKIQECINHSHLIDGHTLYSTSSIGINLFMGQQCSLDELLKYADAAMYQAKDDGRNTICFFDPVMQRLLEERIRLESDLRLAIERQELRLYYQIQVGKQSVLGAEVLLRWEHPQRGLVSPAKFIPLAEETGLIVPIGTWVLQTSCAQLKKWQSDPKTCELTLAVNVSAKQFHQANFVDVVRENLQSSGINPALLKLELTESVVQSNIDETISKMHELKQMGIKFSMDDFGTGYSSLSYLKRLPLDQLKIDQSFVRDLPGDRHDAAIVQTIIAMASALDLHIIAEGVEKQEHMNFLRDSHCHSYQGYLFGKPMPLEQFEALLAEPELMVKRYLLASSPD